MNITGIITEYNPFHNGHMHHLQECKKNTKCDGVICIMSGNFMQRGGPAIIDKWKRAQMAIENGVDLVIELPTYYAVSSAEFFAYGSVSILNSLEIVNNLFFGSECGDIKSLTKIAQTLVEEPWEFKEILKRNREILEENKCYLKEWLKAHPHLSCVIPKYGTVCFLKYDYKIDSNTFCETLQEETGVFFVPGCCFDVENHLRFGLANDPQIVKEGLEVFSNWLKKLDTSR